MIEKLIKQTLKLEDSSIIKKYDRAFFALSEIFLDLRKHSSREKILVTSTTCPTPIYAAIYAGFQVDFVDINQKDYLMNFQQTKEKLYRKKYAALLYIYIFGHTSKDSISLKKKCRETGTLMIEDVAQAFGARINEDYMAGALGDYSVISFGYSKQIDAGGGGAL